VKVVSGIEAEINKVRQEAEERAKRKREQESRLEYGVKAAESSQTDGASPGDSKEATTKSEYGMSSTMATLASGGKKKREYISLDGEDDVDEGVEGVEDMGDGGVKLSGDTPKDVMDLTGGSGMDIDEPEEKGKKTSTGSGRKQRAVGTGMKRGRD
jgi:hypothetical protein